jgi:MFS family permease
LAYFVSFKTSTRRFDMGGDLPKTIYYGWCIVCATFGILFVCAGIGFSTLTVFLKFIEHDMSWDRSILSMAGGLSALSAGFCAPFAGYVIDRFGPRTAMIPGALTLSASFFLLGSIEAIYQLYILFLGVGLGMAATTILPSQTLIARWFEKKRGRAMGIISVAIGLGGVIWFPLATRLVEEFGWRSAYRILGVVIAFASLPLIFFVIRSSPAEMGLAVDGETDVSDDGVLSIDEDAVAEEKAGYTLREALRTPSLWLIACATFFITVPSSGFGLHILAFLTDSGLSEMRAAYAWGATLAVSIVGRFFFGWISEWFQKRYFAATANAIRAFSLLLLVLFAFEILPPALAIIQLAVLYGFGNGCNAVMNPLIIGETFGVRSFGKIMGVIGVPFTIGMALGQIAAGKFYVMMNDYDIIFVVFAISFMCAGTAISFAKPLFLLKTREALARESA